MADDAPAKAAKGGLNFLTQKVGPLPLGIWLVAGVGIWWYLQRQQAASASVGGPPIDPATGFPSGSPQDAAALAGDSSGTTGGGSAGQGATSGGQAYADNNAWGIAAINYLVGLGIDATTANQAIEQYLNSQPLTTAQQGDVNLAIQALGPPPSLPGPVQVNPQPVTGGGGGASPGQGLPGQPGPVRKPPGTGGPPPPVTRPPVGGGGSGKGKPTASVPAGLVISAKHSTSLQVKWNKSRNATGYHVLCTDMATKKITNEFDVPAAQTDANCGGLTPGHSYVIDVWAEPEAGPKGTGAHARVSTTLPRTG